MKKLIMTLSLCCLTAICANAQEVYKEILRLSKNVANDASKDLEARKIATFKVDGLEYMIQRTREQMPDSSVSVLDYQAYAMYEYVNLFMKRITSLNKKEKNEIIEVFKQATIQNPRFRDNDYELVMSYINADGYLTRFSLNTDWIKALADVKKMLNRPY